MAVFNPLQILTAALLNALFDKIMAPPTTTSSTGTASSGTTDTMDAVLSTYTFTAVAGRRYRATLSGCIMVGSVTGDTYWVRIRDGGVSTPTGASPAVAETRFYASNTSGSGQIGLPGLSGTFTPAAGTRTLAVFVQRTVGTGSGQPLGNRELYVEDIGT